MATTVKPLLVQVTGKESGDRWELVGQYVSESLLSNDWVYRFKKDGKSYKLIVPLGFKSDGASVPRWLQAIVKMGGRNMPDEAWLPHDFLYAQKGRISGYLFIENSKNGWEPVTKVGRKFVDQVFLNELKQNKHGLSSFKSPLAYLGVRIGGKFYWKD